MFGTYRTYLAIAVMAHHLIGIPYVGHYAVHGFFILSGYLMTYIMHNNYGYTIRGVVMFSVNRVIRLYPAYWLIMVLTILLIFFYSENDVRAYRYIIFMPDSLWAWLQNITLIFPGFFPGSNLPRLSPPTWALTIEIFYYLIIALGASKSLKVTLFFLLASVVYMLTTCIAGLEHAYRYASIGAGALPFALGSLLYHLRSRVITAVEKYNKPRNIFFLFSFFWMNPALVFVLRYFFEINLEPYSYGMNYLLNFLIIGFLLTGRLPQISKKSDKILGDFSYPIYLMHWQVGFFSSMLFYDEAICGFSLRGIFIFLLAFVISVIISWVIIICIDRPIVSLRQNIRSNAVTVRE